MRRFPQLAERFSLHTERDIPEDIPAHLVAPIEIIPARQGLATAKENGRFLHSAYNPLREAEQGAHAAKNSVTDCTGCAFFSAGLGYTLLSYVTLFPNDTVILIENDPRYFFTALAHVDFSAFFSALNCIVALGAGIDSVVSLIEHSSGLTHTALCENSAQSAHAADYFSALRSLIERNKRKVAINASTLEKFSHLWLKNTCKNLHFLSDHDGITIFKDSCPPSLPALILAAGPTLAETLPHLAELKKRTIVIAVDTALRACLRAGVEPDFVVLTDPQYYAYRHIAGLSAPSSILITESAAYPPVFQFPCKKIVMCASLFPLGAYIESKIGSKGALVAGGSVSTTAWDFARFIGAREIFTAGLDLGFPHLQTHIKGSTFEESIHAHSQRLTPAEFLGTKILFGADIQRANDYSNAPILTDSKMKMFAWWFESKAEEFKDTLTSYTLSQKSLKIPGFAVSSIAELLSRDEQSAQKESFFSHAEKKACFPLENAAPRSETARERETQFNSTVETLKQGLEELYATAKKGMRLADEGIASSHPHSVLSALESIDARILHSEFKEIASLVFPSERKLSALFENLPVLQDKIKSSLQKSKLIYKELMSSIRQYQKFL